MIETPEAEVALPHFEDRLSGELARLHADRRSHRPPPAAGRPSRRRGPLYVGLAAVAAAAALVVAVATQDPDGGGAGGGPPEVELTLAEVTERTNAALQSIPPNAIRYEESDLYDYPTEEIETEDGVIVAAPEEGITRGELVGRVQSWYDPVTGASRRRVVDLDGDVITDGGWPEPPGLDEQPAPGVYEPQAPVVGQCDPQSGLMLDENGTITSCNPGVSLPEPPMHAWRDVDHCARTWSDTHAMTTKHPGYAYFRLFLDTGDLVLDGTEEVDGRELVRIRNHDGSSEILVDPDTYLPLQMTLQDQTTTYDYLPRTTENLAQLSPEVPDGFAQTPEPPADVLEATCD